MSLVVCSSGNHDVGLQCLPYAYVALVIISRAVTVHVFSGAVAIPIIVLDIRLIVVAAIFLVRVAVVVSWSAGGDGYWRPEPSALPGVPTTTTI